MKALLLFVLTSGLLHAAISTNVQWEVRTTGSDNNGGGFVAGATGTDFSQQDAAQFSGTDLASANGTTNPCTVTSATHNFVAADVGNVIFVTGTNWGAAPFTRYQIVSAAGNAATLDRACGTVASISGGTWAEGGGLATLQTAITVTNSNVDGANGTIDGTINVKAGTYTLTTSLTTNANYSIVFIGYQTTHGDGGTAPLITTATNSTILCNFGGQSYYFDNFAFTNTAVTPAVGLQQTSGAYLVVRNSSFSGFTNAINWTGSTGALLIGVEIKNSTGDGYTGNGLTCIGCWIHNNTGNGVTASTATLINSIVSNNAIGMRVTGGNTVAATCIGSDLANNSSDGLRALTTLITLSNCAVYGNGGFGVNGPGIGGTAQVVPVNFGRNNAYGSNTSGNLNAYTSSPGAFTATALALGDVTLTANPFTSATNFAPNATAGGGASLTGGGWPGTFPGGATTGNFNIGAVQASAGGGSGGSTSTGRMVMPGAITFQ